MTLTRALRGVADASALLMLAMLALPVIGLVVGTSPSDLAKGLTHPDTLAALWLSVRTTLVTMVVVIVAGTALAWRLSRSNRRRARVLEVIVELPVVLPPAVIGVALLQTFGRAGLFGPALNVVGLSIPFTTLAVVLAQIIVAGPFYVQSATAAFRGVDDDLLLVSRTLGAPPMRTFLRVAVPAAAPGLLTGAALTWARALGEFGATLLFAGNLPGRTQTLPLAIFTQLESDVGVARSISLLLLVVALVTLLALRLLPRVHAARSGPA